MRRITACVILVCLLILCGSCSAEVCEEVDVDWIPSNRAFVHPRYGWDYYNDTDTIYGPKEVVYTKDSSDSLYSYSQLFWDLSMSEQYLDGWGIYSPESGYVPTQAQRENCYIAEMKDGSTVILPKRGNHYCEDYHEEFYYDAERDAIIRIVAGTPYSAEEADSLLRSQYENCGIFTEEDYQRLMNNGQSASSVPLGDNSVSMPILGILLAAAFGAAVFCHYQQRALRK